MSRPWADASLFPCTIFPTMTDAGPTSGTDLTANTQLSKKGLTYTLDNHIKKNDTKQRTIGKRKKKKH